MEHSSVVTIGLAAGLAAACFVGSSAAAVGPPTEAQCLAARHKAAAKYAACQQNAQARFAAKDDLLKFIKDSSKCRVKYGNRWTKLQTDSVGTGTTCDQNRFRDDGTTVTDTLTGLQWEKKTNMDDLQNPADPHDADNIYEWNNLTGSAADGDAFTAFLSSLNSGACFAGQCDWRLPTRDELQTILSQPFPCTTPPCVDPALGPTAPDFTWSATTKVSDPSTVWVVNLGTTLPNYADVFWVVKTIVAPARAVRGGL